MLDATRVPIRTRGVARAEELHVRLVADGSVSVPFAIEAQSRTYWCWIAVAASVRSLYLPDSRIAQCDLAGQLLGGSCCDGSSCNRRGHLETALEAVGHLAAFELQPVLASTLMEDVRNGRVIGALIAQRGGGGHFVVISGVRPSVDGMWLQVDDPWDGSRTTALYDQFRSNFMHLGYWRATYRTER